LILFFRELIELGAEQLQFHEPNSTSFYRAHSPGKFGDDLSDLRPLLVKVNKEGVEGRGLEEGVAGFGFRAVIPVIWEGKHEGSAEVGMQFGIKL
jgi:methyl-accepting chemotaxis protein